jgi:solute carrier family 25 (mitochondrial oxoglutarate transporter), member 11
MVKVRIQVLAGENPGTKYSPIGVAKMILKNDGPKAFYKGLDAAMMRQLTYTTSRFGIFLNM